MSHVAAMLGDDEYVGYTLHYSSPKVFQKVAAHLSMRASAGGKFRYNIYLRPLEKFLFLKAHTKMTKNAVQCFLKKDKVLTRHSCKVCFHKEESTVVDGLTDTMQLATDRSDCVYYFPARVESPLAVDADIAVTAGSDTAAGMSDGAAGSAVTAGSDISSSRVVALDGPNAYQAEFPTLYLTPTLLRRNNGLETRGQAYNICSQLISSDRGNVYSGLKGGTVVSIKCLGAHALEDPIVDRTVREIFTLEKGHDRGACFPASWTPSRNRQIQITGSVWYSKCLAFHWTSFGRCTVTAGRTHNRAGTFANWLSTVAELFPIFTIRYVFYIQTSRSPTSLSRFYPAV